jgi:hypothetical protein
MQSPKEFVTSASTAFVGCSAAMTIAGVLGGSPAIAVAGVGMGVAGYGTGMAAYMVAAKIEESSRPDPSSPPANHRSEPDTEA